MVPIPVLLCFDVEPDERDVALGPRPWLGFERVLERTAPLREELAALTGHPVQFNWFIRMDPQIDESHGSPGWAAERYWDQIQTLRKAGDTIGLHPHCARWSKQQARWIADHGNPEWVDECIRLSFETYLAVFGEPCRVIRFGDRFLSANALRLAAHLGARFDLTVEPGMPGARWLGKDSLSTGRIPSHTKAPREPYRPSVLDPFRRAEEGVAANGAGLWMIPLTAMHSGPLIPLWKRVGRRVKNPRSPRYRTAILPRPCRAQEFWSLIEGDLDSSRRPYLAFATRTDTFIRRFLNAAFEEKLAALHDWPPARRLTFTTPETVVAAVEAGQRAAAGGL